MESATLSRAKRIRNAVVYGLKRFLMFLFSHVGLTSAVVAYTILGGIIFQGLEAPYEVQQRDKVVTSREKYTKDLLKLSENLGHTETDVDAWRKSAMKSVEGFQNEVYIITTSDGWDGKDVDEELQWSFPGAMLFAVTVITTIGYGHIAPITGWGRIVTMLYAVVGIPLTFLCVRNIGSLLSSCVKLIYQHACVGLMKRWLRFKKRMRESRRVSRLREVATRARKWSLVNMHLVHSSDNKVADLSSNLAQQLTKNDTNELSVTEDDQCPAFDQPKSAESTKVRVPISLTLCLMTGYIIGGAIMFSVWENGWDFLIASYFCFITLTTIGFGDFVPGSSIDPWGSQEKRVICCVYLLLGMAMQAMCFHLMQEEVRFKFRRLAQKMGLMDSNDEQDGNKTVV